MNPSLTPLTMLLTRARLKPCSALASASSPSRLNTTIPSATLRLVRRGNSISSLPFGPSTKTFRAFNSTFTLGGMAIGCFPIRDIKILSPDEAKQFAAQIFLPGLRAGHDPFRSRNNRDAQPAAHAGDVRGADI